ncbi:hypothetical protein BC828DRAFT_407297 [Blastocladiella britannica]|nr:hypothetical protein BC828DRAFT_407297 [Blastocladiella britannica]
MPKNASPTRATVAVPATIKEKDDALEARAILSAMMDRPIRVSIQDGRILEGRLRCIDRDRNLVLADTMDNGKTEIGAERFVALVMIPGKLIVATAVRPDVAQVIGLDES